MKNKINWVVRIISICYILVVLGFYFFLIKTEKATVNAFGLFRCLDYVIMLFLIIFLVSLNKREWKSTKLVGRVIISIILLIYVILLVSSMPAFYSETIQNDKSLWGSPIFWILGLWGFSYLLLVLLCQSKKRSRKISNLRYTII